MTEVTKESFKHYTKEQLIEIAYRLSQDGERLRKELDKLQGVVR